MRCEKAWEGKMRDHDLGSPSKYQDHQLEISCVYVCPFAKQDYQVEILCVCMSVRVFFYITRLSSWDFVCVNEFMGFNFS